MVFFDGLYKYENFVGFCNRHNVDVSNFRKWAKAHGVYEVIDGVAYVVEGISLDELWKLKEQYINFDRQAEFGRMCCDAPIPFSVDNCASFYIECSKRAMEESDDDDLPF